MFNFNALKSLKNKVQPVKAVASNGFLGALNDLKEVEEVKSQIVKKENSPEDKYSNLYQEAIDLFKEAIENIDTEDGFNKLEEAAGLFAELTNIRKTKAEPYFYLSYIFFILEDLQLAIKYFKVANFINPDMPGLDTLKSGIEDSINNAISHEKEIKKEAPKPVPKVTTVTQPYRKPGVTGVIKQRS